MNAIHPIRTTTSTPATIRSLRNNLAGDESASLLIHERTEAERVMKEEQLAKVKLEQQRQAEREHQARAAEMEKAEFSRD